MYTDGEAKKYDALSGVDSDYQFGTTDYIVTKTLPKLLDEHSRSLPTLDFGCGTGLSTRFLTKLGFKPVSVDISKEMLSIAKKNDPKGQYIHISPNEGLPFENTDFKLVVSIFVLFEIPTKSELTFIFNEINRILETGGYFVAITGSEDLYQRDWITLDNKYPENKQVESGKVCKIKLKNIDLEIDDYFWTDEDYGSLAEKSGFVIEKKLFPCGSAEDGVEWQDELSHAPYVFYKFKKVTGPLKQ